jgi:hypothetical protein
MSVTGSGKIEGLVDQVKTWPSSERLRLARMILETLEVAAPEGPRVTGQGEDVPGRPSPNTALLAALKEVEEIQRDMNPTELSPTQEYLEEARSGAMYGYRGDDDREPDRS